MISLSLYINYLESMAIFFFHGPSCVHIFSSSLYTWTFMCSYFFDSPCLFFLQKTGERERERERDQHILWSIYFVEWVDGTTLTSQRGIARGIRRARESWSWNHDKNFSQGSQQFDKAQCKTSSICVHGFQDTSSHGFGRIFGILKRSFARGFSNF